ncbi:MAG: DUF4031 domain-containing protein [Cyclobacteriaceae bacterium]
MIYTDGTFLLADSVRELRKFAKEIDLPEKNLNQTSFFPHYAITSTYWEQAIQEGACHVTTQELYQIAKRLYDT